MSSSSVAQGTWQAHLLISSTALRGAERIGSVISFNCDLVPERALKPLAEQRHVLFERWLYGLAPKNRKLDLPLLLKLHGSSNWKPTTDGSSAKIKVRTKTWEHPSGALEVHCGRDPIAIHGPAARTADIRIGSESPGMPCRPRRA